jgi:MscS family membrane protein
LLHVAPTDFAPLLSASGQESVTNTTPAEPPAVDPELAIQLGSPAATMKTFITAVNDDNLDLAAQCLDASQLGPIDVIKVQTAKSYARQLKNGVLDKMFRVDYTALPTEMPDDIDVFALADVVEGETEDIHEDLAAIKLSRGPDNLWRFSAETVQAIPELWKKWNDKETVRLTEENKSEQSIARNVQDLFFQNQYLRNPWIACLAILATGILAHWLLCAMLGAITRIWFRVRHGDADARSYNHVWRPAGFCVQSVVWYFGVNYVLLDTRSELSLFLGPNWTTILIFVSIVLLGSILIVAAIWTLFGFINLGATYWQRRASQTASKFDDMLVPLVSRTLKIVVICLCILTVAQMFGFPLTGLFGAMGIVAMALALASKDAVSNLFGTATVLIDHPFEVGDWIKTDGVEGTVEAVGFRSTRIRTFYNSLITLPNSRLTTAVVDNMGKRQYRRITATLGLGYDSTPQQIEAFCEGVREVIRRHPYTRKDYYHVYLNGFGDSALEVMLYCFVECGDWSIELREKHRLYLDIMRLAETVGVEFAFPTQTLHMFQEQHPSNGNADIPDPILAGQQHARAIVGEALNEKNRPGPVEFPGPAESHAPKYADRGSNDDAE